MCQGVYHPVQILKVHPTPRHVILFCTHLCSTWSYNMLELSFSMSIVVGKRRSFFCKFGQVQYMGIEQISPSRCFTNEILLSFSLSAWPTSSLDSQPSRVPRQPMDRSKLAFPVLLQAVLLLGSSFTVPFQLTGEGSIPLWT